MFAHRIPLFTLYGFRVGVDLSWFLLAILLVWSLSGGYFPSVVPELSSQIYFWMGVAGAIGLFASIVFHEFAHAMVARRFDLPIGGITLFIFGGVAEMEEEPRTPAAEFWMAIAGPIASVFLAAVFYGLSAMAAWPPALHGVLAYLAFINLVLAIFNMLPAFPLDGGRVLRSALWWFTNDLTRATRIASIFGFVLGGALMVLGILNIVSGAFVVGIWQLLIGFFIQSAAGASRSQVEMRQGLRHIRVREIMRPDVIAVPRDTTLDDLVQAYFYRYYHKFFPVTDAQGRPLGCVRLGRVKEVPRERWGVTRVEEIMEPIGPDNVLEPGDTAVEALKRMRSGGGSRFMVVQGGTLKGVLTMRDILDALAIRLELEEGRSARSASGAMAPRGSPAGEGRTHP